MGPIIRAIPKPGGPDPLPLGPRNGKGGTHDTNEPHDPGPEPF